MKHKYIRFEDYGFILWPMTDKLWHKSVGEFTASWLREETVSAGFANFDDKGNVHCYGESESLGIKSKPEDTNLLCKQLGLLYKD